jgi:hypothetical protein
MLPLRSKIGIIGLWEIWTIFYIALFRDKKCDIRQKNACFLACIRKKPMGCLGPTSDYPGKSTANNRLHPTVTPLRSVPAGKAERYLKEVNKQS